jgi:erythromycin esterase-like protein
MTHKDIRQTPNPADAALAARLQAHAHPLTGDHGDFDEIVEMAGHARYVLLGEASHGTHDFYAARADITRRLIAEKDYRAVAVEADWPDANRVNRYVRGVGEDGTADQALADFRRFPTWMWRNRDVAEFVDWLREKNREPHGRTGFYGLDLYSLHASVRAVLDYLSRVDPPAAQRARYRYGCLDHSGEDPQAYGYAASFGLTESCEREVVEQLLELRRNAAQYAERDGAVAEDDYFFAEQNARLVRNAERYYRSMFQGRVSSWNIRDSHMFETLQALTAHLERRQPGAKIVVWAHNSHLGDARATAMGDEGELNLGQLVRDACGREALLVGFTTHEGTVTAASEWDGPAMRKRVRPSLPGSYERLFHEAGVPRFYLRLREHAIAAELEGRRLERAIGVIYRPETERASHYFEANLPRQFDAVLHFDQTTAVEPLDPVSGLERDEVPETFPFGV